MIGAIEVLERRATWSVDPGDCIAWMDSLPADCVDLLITSPPYELARLYLEKDKDLGIARKTEEWVAWMVRVCRAASRICRGLCAFVVEGQTRKFRYTCSPDLLRADLCRAGFNLRKSPIFHRVGIPGSGGPDWIRNDYEPIVCFTRPGKLPYSDNTACGHPPKWAPGGAMSHRMTNGQRVNAADDPWHQKGSKNSAGKSKNGKPQKKAGAAAKLDEVLFDGENLFDAPPAPVDEDEGTKTRNAKKPNGTIEHQTYVPPKLANPGNNIQRVYTADEVAALLAEANDILHCKVGGGQMGHALAHQNEAPFPTAIPEFFIKTWSAPGMVVCDPFAGSGTTLEAAVKLGRRAIGCDLRQSQVDISRRRVAGVTPILYNASGEAT